MIRFLNIPFLKVQSRNSIEEYEQFLNKDDDFQILLIYDKENYVGYIDSEAFSKKCIFRDCYYHLDNDWKLFTNLKSLFLLSDAGYIPIFSQESNQLLCFAYDDYCEDYIVKRFENYYIKETLIDNNIDIFDVFPHSKAFRLFDINEWTYFLVLLLEKDNIKFEVTGVFWKLLYPDYCSYKVNIPETEVFKYYSEGCIPCGIATLSEIANTVKSFWATYSDYNYAVCMERIKEKYLNCGVNCFTVYTSDKDNEYISLAERYRHYRGLAAQKSREFWTDEIDYNQICSVLGKQKTFEEFSTAIETTKKDCKIIGEYCTVHNYNEKITTNKCFVIGPCIVQGWNIDAKEEKFCAFLQYFINEISDSYTVQGITVRSGNYGTLNSVINSLSIKKNDIIVMFAHGLSEKELLAAGIKSTINFGKIIRHRTTDWFYDVPIHTNKIGNKNIAQIIVNDYLRPVISKADLDCSLLQAGIPFLSEKKTQTIKTYIESTKRKDWDSSSHTIGAVVMNCNPMTNGHLHLIETARTQVDYLYVFVVEENRSFFSFSERFSVVKKVTGKMKNVSVVPSGKFIVSEETMSVYFEKNDHQNEKVDFSTDLELFGAVIAKSLGISIRFIGEEPIDNVTKAYNREMLEMLPLYGLTVREIKRKTIENNIISASLVRKSFAQNDFETIRKLVPLECYEFLIKKRGMHKV